MPSFDAICEVLWSLWAAAVIGLSAFGFGRPLVRKLSLGQDDSLAVAVWSMTLGLVAVGSALLLLAWAGWIHPAVVAAISLAGGLWSMVELACVYLGHANGRVLLGCPPPEPVEVLELGLGSAHFMMAPVAVVLATTLMLALAPPTSPEALSGSLEIPKNILLSHSLYGPWQDSPPATNIAQMWSLWALALDGPVAANLVHWGVGLLAVLATTLLARVFLSVQIARLAGCLALVCPGVQYQLGVPLDDMALALFAALALAAVFRVLVNLETAAWPVAAGVALGAAVAVQPAGVPLAATIAVLGAYACWSQSPAIRGHICPACTIALVALIIAGPWVYLADSMGPSSSPQSPQSTLAHLGPILCLGMTALAFARRLRGLNLVLGVLVLYPVLAHLSPLPGRWWSVLVAPAGVVAAWAWHETIRLPRPAGLLSSCCLCTMALAPAVSQWPAAAGSLAVATGWQRRGDFLLTREPTYRAASLLNRISRTDDRMLCQDARMFYFDCQTRWRAEEDAGISSQSNGDRDRNTTVRARRGGFTYLLLAEAIDDASGAAKEPVRAAPSPRAGSATATEFGPIGEVIPILEYRFADDNNRLIRYRLLRLAGSRDRIH